ncbi:MAG: glutamine synthetase family protein [Betaproteobacteria bacterium]
MSTFAARCGRDAADRSDAVHRVLQAVREQRLQRVRVGWCDTHGVMRGKTLMVQALQDALDNGLGLVGTMLLKDTSDRTAWPVFDAAVKDQLPGFEFAGNLMLLPDPATFHALPWAPDTGALLAQAWFADGRPVPFDTRRVLQRALQALGEVGYGLRCGLEVEFHIYRITDARLDPAEAAWPHEPPQVQMLHPGYHLLSEEWGDQADEALRIVQATAQGLGLPLRSLEIELGPSQFEAVFDVMDALAAADAMVLFRNGVRQALRRAGYHASFVCRPPFPNIMSSGWHLHHSLVEQATGRNVFVREEPAPGSTALDAEHTLSAVGAQWLAGLLAHAPALTALCVPTVNAYGRFRPNALAPQSVLWGRDNRGALLRVVGGAGDGATRIENRLGEPSANPYLTMAAHVHAGLDGLRKGLVPPPATEAPYDGRGQALPKTLAEALSALNASPPLRAGLGDDVVDWFIRLKSSEVARHEAAADKADWDRREYFGRL